MNIFLKIAAALAVAIVTAPAANAALVTNTYSTVSTFNYGSHASITQKFTLTFDPTSNAAATITDYRSSGPAITSVLGEVRRFYSSRDNVVSIRYSDAEDALGRGSTGYQLDILFNADGTAIVSGLQYSSSLGLIGSSSSVTSIVNDPIVPGGPGTGGPVPDPVAGAVPEPATWAMMLLGFGLLGSAMRRRRAAPRYA